MLSLMLSRYHLVSHKGLGWALLFTLYTGNLIENVQKQSLRYHVTAMQMTRSFICHSDQIVLAQELSISTLEACPDYIL